MKEICVVHLVRAQNGTEPFVRFLKSYRQNPGGIEHDLLIVFKGFNNPNELSEYELLLENFKYLSFKVTDEGFDFTVYFAVVNRYSEQYQYFCFLNSYSVIQDNSWLEKLHRHVSPPNVGLVGATGSWQSHRGGTPSWRLPYAIFVRSFRHDKNSFCCKRLLAAFYKSWRQLPFFMSFDLFPNYHVRTNAFMISSELMKTIKCPLMQSKFDAYRMESGKLGFTRQVLASGNRVLVVGKDGVGYEKELWHKSNTFWQSNQENLLVADNQTRNYMDGDQETRQYLLSKAWGVSHFDEHSPI